MRFKKSRPLTTRSYHGVYNFFFIVPFALAIVAYSKPELFLEKPDLMASVFIAMFAVTSLAGWSNPAASSLMMMSPFRIDRYRETYRFVSSGLIHKDLMHIVLNSYALYSFGASFVYDLYISYGDYGPLIFVVFFFVMVVLADLPDYIIHRNNSGFASLGASGGISAIIAASVVFEPTIQISFLGFGPFQGPTFVVGYLLVSIGLGFNPRSQIGHWAHAAGTFFGFVAAYLMVHLT